MMQTKPEGFSGTPLAIRISFIANYSLDTCKDRLLDIQIAPSRWRSFWGAPHLKFRVVSVGADLWAFYADRYVDKAEVIAKGCFQRIDNQTTLVTGYSDAKISFYLFLLFGVGMMLLLAGQIYNGTTDGLYVSSAIVVSSLIAILANLLYVRNKAKDLARTIEETLTQRLP